MCPSMGKDLVCTVEVHGKCLWALCLMLICYATTTIWKIILIAFVPKKSLKDNVYPQQLHPIHMWHVADMWLWRSVMATHKIHDGYKKEVQPEHPSSINCYEVAALCTLSCHHGVLSWEIPQKCFTGFWILPPMCASSYDSRLCEA